MFGLCFRGTALLYSAAAVAACRFSCILSGSDHRRRSHQHDGDADRDKRSHLRHGSLSAPVQQRAGVVDNAQIRSDAFPQSRPGAFFRLALFEQTDEYVAEREHDAVMLSFSLLLLPLVLDADARVSEAGFDRALAAFHHLGDLADLHAVIVVQSKRPPLSLGQTGDDRPQLFCLDAAFRGDLGQHGVVL